MSNFNQFEDRGRKYFKHNYIEVLESLTPKFYLQDDLDTFDRQISPVDEIINSHIDVVNNFNTIFNISGTTEGSALRTFSGAAGYFVKQNNPLKLDAFDFDRLILNPLGKKLNEFSTSADFRNYVVSTLLPNIQLNNPIYLFNKIDQAAAHDYLINNLSWLYFLNKPESAAASYQPSSYVLDLLVKKIYYGETIRLNDGIKGLTNYIWKNYTTCSLFESLIPTAYKQGSEKFTSGTQSLQKLETLVDVIYSPLLSDSKDTRVQDAFDNYIAVGEYKRTIESAGAFRKLLVAMSYGMFDINDQVNNILLLHSIDDCPDQYLPYLADIIGWELIGPNPDRWRMQLKNAVAIYKAKGTKTALQLVTDTLFGLNNSDKRSVDSNIQELWESYIPNLLYYALATETSAFANFDVWSHATAEALNIPDYSDTDMDTNIRLVVDDIIRRAAYLFPDKFFIGTRPFTLDDESFVFKYRGRITNIPPWEMEKYYRYCGLDKPMLDYFYDRLVCLGVRKSFADDWYSYIEKNVFSDDRISPRNGWLFFTQNNELPSNYDYILGNLDQKKYKFLSLWNGKSSHFNLSLTASTFNINTDSFQFGSYTGLQSVSRAIDVFTPAHAIPNLDLNILDSDTAGYNEIICPNVVFTPDDIFVSGAIAGFESSGMNMSSLGRVFKRTAVDNISDVVFTSTTPLANLRRTSVRRRNYKNIISKDGWYYRDGFNMPPYFAASSVQNSNYYLPLGYIPSAGKYVAISDYKSLPQVYTKCEDLNSDSVINGVITSSTFPCRGIDYYLSSCASYATRGDADPIIGLMHRKFVERAYADAASSLTEEAFFTTYQASAAFMDIARNLSNASGGPNSIEDYFGFEFGRGVHRAYRQYVTYFSGHDLSEQILDLSGGPNVISHAYGPLLFNGFFDKAGSAATTYKIITSAIGSEVLIDSGYGSGILSILGSPSGTYVASTPQSLYVEKYEFRNPHILSGLEFVQTSGDSEKNSFVVYNLSVSDSRESQENFAFVNSLIKMKSSSFYGLPRLRYSLRNYDIPNLLIPEHEFELTTKLFIGKESGGNIGGGAVGVWIHTDPEDGYVWSYDRDFNWVVDPVTDLNLQKVQNLSHYYSIPLQSIPDTVLTSSIPCINQVFETSTITKIGIENLTSALFQEFKIKFNTFNPPICIPNYYSTVGKQVHRSNQGYTIEIFMLPDETNDTYTILDYVECKDISLNTDVSKYTPAELLTVFRYFVDIAGARASRQAAITSGSFDTSGGSRLNYRYHPDWGPNIKSAGFNQYTQIDIYR